jgi:DNA polymerase-3 subunit gamma/tau
LDLARWQELLAPLSLRGPLRELAHNAVPLALDAGRLRLGLRPVHEHLRSDALVRQLTELLAPALGAGLRLQFEAIDGSADSVADKQRRDDAARQIQAEAAIAADPVVRGLMAQFDAKVVPNSARPKTRE